MPPTPHTWRVVGNRWEGMESTGGSQVLPPVHNFFIFYILYATAYICVLYKFVNVQGGIAAAPVNSNIKLYENDHYSLRRLPRRRCDGMRHHPTAVPGADRPHSGPQGTRNQGRRGHVHRRRGG